MEIDEHDEHVASVRAATARPCTAKPPGYTHSIGATVGWIFSRQPGVIEFGAVVGYAAPEQVHF
jgi:hypothetical protein